MLVTRVIASAPNLLDLHRRAPQRYPLLLESAAHGTAHGQWDLLLAANGQSLTLHCDGVTRCERGGEVSGGFLPALDAQWHRAWAQRNQIGWPFRGGWALLLGYELAAQLEPVLALPAAAGMLPVAQALRCPAALLHDRASGEVIALAETGHVELLDQIAVDVAAATASSVPACWVPPIAILEDLADEFILGVGRVHDYLAAGDVFQVNLSRGWQARFDYALAPATLYQRLRQVNPAPFAGIYAGTDWAVVSASPERLVAVRGDIVETRPIAGTCPRLPGDDDASRICEMVSNAKERAEHVMLIDLERNDLGRVCMPGSIQVDELMTVESYAHVHHIVSNVRGHLRPGTTPGAVIGAVFPGGTITGCPKLRCMQVIAELEHTGRGAYTGAIGWLNCDGDMDLNILIRSAELQTHGSSSTLRFRAGAGIVVDSKPERELEETRAKARGMLRALDGRCGNRPWGAA